MSANALLINQGTIYASLVRLQQRGWIDADWGVSDNNRRAKFYSLTRTWPAAPAVRDDLLADADRGHRAGAHRAAAERAMSRLRGWWRRLTAMGARQGLDRDFSEERAAHLRMAADDYERRGLAPDEARRRARLAFGSEDAAVELHRDTRGLPLAENVMRDADVRGSRGMRRDAGLVVVGRFSFSRSASARTRPCSASSGRFC